MIFRYNSFLFFAFKNLSGIKHPAVKEVWNKFREQNPIVEWVINFFYRWVNNFRKIKGSDKNGKIRDIHFGTSAKESFQDCTVAILIYIVYLDVWIWSMM